MGGDNVKSPEEFMKTLKTIQYMDVHSIFVMKMKLQKIKCISKMILI